MIAPLPGWTFELVAGGARLVPPEGLAAGAILYAERVRPLRRMADLMRPERGFDALRVIRAPERLVTAEGEYGGIASVEIEAEGVTLRRTVGCVFGDDFYSKTIAIALQADQFERFEQAVRALVVGDAHGLGALRRRRFLYQPPAGWVGLARLSLLHASFYPPGYPRDASEIVVYPAWPAPPETRVETIARLVAAQTGEGSGLTLVDAQPPEPARAASGLRGVRWRFELARGEPMVRDLFALEDDRFVYLVQVDSPPPHREHNFAIGQEIVGSIEPIPRPEEGSHLHPLWSE